MNRLPGHAPRNLKRDAEADLAAVQAFLFGALESEVQVQINDRATFQIQQKLNSFSGLRNRKGGAADFVQAVNDYLAPISPAAIHGESEALYRRILDRRDYTLLLKHFNRKSLASRVSRNLGLGEGEYPRFVLRFLQRSDGEPLRLALRSCFPGILVPTT